MKLIQDTVQYKRLIWKLRSYRINSDIIEIISWVENFLLDRSQYYVETIGNNHSGSQSLAASLRGSVPGPLLYFIYINDLPKQSCKLHNILCMLLKPKYIGRSEKKTTKQFTKRF